MRLQGYRIKKVQENIDKNINTQVITVSGTVDYYVFPSTITIFPDDVITTNNGEEIKAGRRVNECIGYCVINSRFDSFLVKLT